jgi:hypothetical protein
MPPPAANASLLVVSGSPASVFKRVTARLLDALRPGHRVRQSFRVQADFCDKMGSPFTALLCRLAAERLDRSTAVGAALLGWNSHPGNDALPLRFAGAFHALVLSGRAPRLAALYPPHPVPAPGALWAAVREMIVAEADVIQRSLLSPPQTNEVGRSAPLLAAFLTVAAETRLPLFLSELGASAGLNMVWDRFAYDFGGARWGDPGSAVRLAPRWSGPLPPMGAPLSVAARAGCDLNRLNAADSADRLRLLSYVWADQPERIARLRAALEIAAANPPEITRADAADWLDLRLAEQPDGTVHVVYHTIVWQYLPEPTRAHIASALERAGAASTRARALAWLRLEADGKEPGGVLTLTLWPGGQTRTLARADYHGAWVDWTG